MNRYPTICKALDGVKVDYEDTIAEFTDISNSLPRITEEQEDLLVRILAHKEEIDCINPPSSRPALGLMKSLAAQFLNKKYLQGW